MITYNYTDEQRRETIKLLQKIQLNLHWKKARAECENIDSAVKGIYEILDMVKYQTNQPEEKTTRKIYNPVTDKYYDIVGRSSKNKIPIKGLWGKKHKE
jgi:uncharacterized protein (DUF2147 family)